MAYYFGYKIGVKAFKKPILKISQWALAGWLSWLEHHSIHQKVSGLNPGQDTDLGCRVDPWLGHVWKANNWCFSFPLLSLKLNKHFLRCELKAKIANNFRSTVPQWGLGEANESRHSQFLTTYPLPALLPRDWSLTPVGILSPIVNNVYWRVAISFWKLLWQMY